MMLPSQWWLLLETAPAARLNAGFVEHHSHSGSLEKKEHVGVNNVN